ncbi:hypothetical protein Poly24_01550 [Rosistilla carotiformis]|uniref:Uncharacterized protein n=1 Tax=Rosistilla carotiformis TaxID=2528017 RepID=A0A518JLP1_9BACT|nr:hypothetical protein [Rosistilla carotiformis]QDV66469.1 hypothetical protein Poly24_01550 [Rosistilla carotiformis]
MMSFRVSVLVDGNPVATHEIVRGKYSLGSSSNGPIVVNHGEVAAVAAVIEVTGDVVFLENRNDFPIFVGAEQVAPRGVAEWRTGSLVQLTRSVTLGLEAVGANVASVSTSEVAAKKSQNSTMQIGVIILCAVLGYYMLANESKSNNAGSGTGDGNVVQFDDVIKGFELAGGSDFEKLTYEERTLLGYLTEARSLEQRLGKAGKEQTLAAYELVLSSRLHYDSQLKSDVATQAAEFASHRIAVLK